MSSVVFDTVVVGGGPRSSGLIAALGRLHSRHRIAVVDPLPDGAGAIWREAQSPSLLANSTASRIVAGDDPSGGFLGWCRTAAVPVALADEARSLHADSFPSRRLVGEYLRAVAAAVDTSVRPRVEVTRIPARVDSIRERNSVFEIGLAGSSEGVRGSAVVLATGSAHVEPRAVERRHGVPAPLVDVPAGSSVHVTGLGLSFHDIVSILTEDRGGRYLEGRDAAGDGPWVYLPSGAEPLITASSRSGWPIVPKRTVARGVALLPLSRSLQSFARERGSEPEHIVVDEIRRQLHHAGLGSEPLDALDGAKAAPTDVAAWIAHHASAADSAETALAAGVIVATIESFAASVPVLSARHVEALERVGSRLTSGPPPTRFRKLDALVRAGIVRVLTPGTECVAAEWSVRAYSASPTPPCVFIGHDGEGWDLDADGGVRVDAADNRCVLPSGRRPRIALLGAASSSPLVAGLPSPSSYPTFVRECDAVVGGLGREIAAA
ncbi:FAD/NAD(P)-binding protein [Agromyces atrinae]|uniref:FAD/NAD(P)-binding protein n=1 Tax=Agromyces atrinae TaxID=592376 RepID=UPI001F5A8953|nr:FAD/NAD(P)-binding protein [Agromyces atrinae]MCI2957339.1 FAD/NAD(P)-binding protein [Agromyces atrinae]